MGSDNGARREVAHGLEAGDGRRAASGRVVAVGGGGWRWYPTLRVARGQERRGVRVEERDGANSAGMVPQHCEWRRRRRRGLVAHGGHGAAVSIRSIS